MIGFRVSLGAGDDLMTKPVPCRPAPGPLEEYAARFDDLFSRLAQRRGFPDIRCRIGTPAHVANPPGTAPDAPKAPPAAQRPATQSRRKAAKTGKQETENSV